jgi:hypothetical protein
VPCRRLSFYIYIAFGKRESDLPRGHGLNKACSWQREGSSRCSRPFLGSGFERSGSLFKLMLSFSIQVEMRWYNFATKSVFKLSDIFQYSFLFPLRCQSIFCSPSIPSFLCTRTIIKSPIIHETVSWSHHCSFPCRSAELEPRICRSSPLNSKFHLKQISIPWPHHNCPCNTFIATLS